MVYDTDRHVGLRSKEKVLRATALRCTVLWCHANADIYIYIAASEEEGGMGLIDRGVIPQIAYT
jgi:hypothetical protein